MNELSLAILIQAAGVALLLLEVFVPSHGLFGVVGLAAVIGGVYLAFRVGETAGYVSLVSEVVLVPTVVGIGLKVFRGTRIGRRVVPPNPILTAADRGVDVRDLMPLIGERGRSLTPLRPVGMCEFNGRRVQCVAEQGLIDPGVPVEGISIVGDSLCVRPGAGGEGTSAAPAAGRTA